MKIKKIHHIVFLVTIVMGSFFLLSIYFPVPTSDKHKGAHIFGYLNSTNLVPFVENNFNWITMVSYGGQKDYDSPTMTYYKGDSLAVVRRDSMWKNQIDIAHSKGFKVFMKPHIWINNPTAGKWRNDIYPVNEGNWELWQKNYREFILLYAKIAEQNNVELFCMGTELTRLTLEKPLFWRSLIKDVRKIYSGQLTYAANWSAEFENITFWDDLDFIGIQAYFPLVKNEYPSVTQISEGWSKHIPIIETIHKKYNRKVLFTEMGYKSTADSAIEPWQWIENFEDDKITLSYETQANCYDAFFNTIWNKDWFAGVHIWQLRSDYKEVNTYSDRDFTPQFKLAERVIAKGFE
jgi:hypothetical protein